MKQIAPDLGLVAYRHAFVQQIREVGIERHAARMASLGRVTMRRGRG